MREGWVRARLGDVFRVLDRRLGAHDEEPPVFSVTKHDGVVMASEYFGKRIASRDLSKYRVVEPGDFVYSTIHIDEGSIGSNGLGRRGVVSPMYTVLRPTGALADGRFLEFALRAPSMLRVYYEHAAGTVNRRRSLPFSRFSDIPIDLPPVEEQRRIVDVIASVSRCSEAARSLRSSVQTALAGARQALLSPGTGWDESTLGALAAYINGYPFKPSELGTSGLPVVRIRQLLDPSASCNRNSSDLGARFRISDGDLIFSWSGTLAVRVWDRGDAWLNQHLYRVDPAPGIDRSWLRHLLEGSLCVLRARTHGTTMKHITRRDLLSFKVRVPPQGLQRSIGSSLDVMAQLDAVVASELAVLSRLRGQLLIALLSGAHTIPASYDRFLEGVA